MSKIKAGGAAKNVHDSPGQRLGVKLFGGQKVKTGGVIVRQVGQTKMAGPGTFISRNFTIHAAKDGVVSFRKLKKRMFSGKTVTRVEVMVEDATPKAAPAVKKAPAKAAAKPTAKKAPATKKA
jgi:large subunit ribosomal protein L27